MNERVTPHTVNELAECLHDYHIRRVPLSLRGGETHSLSVDPARTIIAFDGLQDIIAYEPDDLTISVHAGMPFNTLQHRLAARGQWLAIEPPLTSLSTVGGVIAAGLAGPSRCMYGSVRDHLLAMRYVCPDGSVAKSGSNVVKSVAGYDVHKMLAGSRGTLCAIAEITFRTAPRPEANMIAVIPMDAAEPIRLWNDLRRTTPALMTTLSSRLARNAHIAESAVFIARWDGFRADLDGLRPRLPEVAEIFYDHEDGYSSVDGIVRQWNAGRFDTVRMCGETRLLLNIFQTISDSHEALLDVSSGVLDIDCAGQSVIPAHANEIHAVYLYRNDRLPGAPAETNGVQHIAAALKSMFDPHRILESWEYYV